MLTYSILSVHHDFIALRIQEKLQGDGFLFKGNYLEQKFQGTGVMPGRRIGDVNVTGMLVVLLNPLSPNIHIQILQTDLHTFP